MNERPRSELSSAEMEDTALRELVLVIEQRGASRPVTLVLNAAVVRGVVVSRWTYLERLKELATRENSPELKIHAQRVAEREEEIGGTVHLVDAFLVSAGGPSTFASDDAAPMRVRVRDVQGWRMGTQRSGTGEGSAH